MSSPRRSTRLFAALAAFAGAGEALAQTPSPIIEADLRRHGGAVEDSNLRAALARAFAGPEQYAPAERQAAAREQL